MIDKQISLLSIHCTAYITGDLWLTCSLVASAQGGLAGIGGLQHGYSAWMAQERQLFCDGAVAGNSSGYQERWVPQACAGMADLAGSKRPRTTSAAFYSYR
jgi:hypothetical protein